MQKLFGFFTLFFGPFSADMFVRSSHWYFLCLWDKEDVGFEPTRRERPNGFQDRPLNQTWVTFHKMNVLNTSDSLSQENLATSDFS